MRSEPFRPSSPVMVAPCDLGLVRAFPLWPLGLDPFEDVTQFVLGIDVGKARHVALIATADHSRRSMQGDLQTHAIGMVPGVPRLVMGRGR